MKRLRPENKELCSDGCDEVIPHESHIEWLWTQARYLWLVFDAGDGCCLPPDLRSLILGLAAHQLFARTVAFRIRVFPLSLWFPSGDNWLSHCCTRNFTQFCDDLMTLRNFSTVFGRPLSIAALKYQLVTVGTTGPVGVIYTGEWRAMTCHADYIACLGASRDPRVHIVFDCKLE